LKEQVVSNGKPAVIGRNNGSFHNLQSSANLNSGGPLFFLTFDSHVPTVKIMACEKFSLDPVMIKRALIKLSMGHFPT
jgi:hypothetical protein